jgi:hypothetical protein
MRLGVSRVRGPTSETDQRPTRIAGVNPGADANGLVGCVWLGR